MQSNALRRREVELFVILAGQGVGYDRISLRRRANETENLANNRGIWGMSAQTAPAAPQPDVAELLAAGLQHHQAGAPRQGGSRLSCLRFAHRLSASRTRHDQPSARLARRLLATPPNDTV